MNILMAWSSHALGIWLPKDRPQRFNIGLFCDDPEECRYKKEPWGDCDLATNTQKRKLVLKRGSGKCEATKELTRNCRKGGFKAALEAPAAKLDTGSFAVLNHPL